MLRTKYEVQQVLDPSVIVQNRVPMTLVDDPGTLQAVNQLRIAPKKNITSADTLSVREMLDLRRHTTTDSQTMARVLTALTCALCTESFRERANNGVDSSDMVELYGESEKKT